jgi:hypothetical protein
MKKLYILIAIVCVTHKLSAQISCNLSAAGSCSASPQFSIGTGGVVNSAADFPSIYGHCIKTLDINYGKRINYYIVCIIF